MKYDPHKYHRRSIRLKGYDYSQAGAYFVTICVQNGQMLLEPDAVREMILVWWHKLAEKFPNVELDEFVIMPNHVHFIVVILDVASGQTRGSAPTEGNDAVGTHPHVRPNPANHPTLGNIVQWFKTMTTNAYIRGVKSDGWEPFPKRLWQRNYYEHIIRTERALNAIRQYIDDNPAKWHEDSLHPDAPINKFNAEWER
ncbi:MAG: transposase [Chloroflexota bacterium]